MDRPRHQLLPGTRLTFDEHRDVGRSDLLHQPDDSLDRLAPPDEIVETALLIQQPAEAVHLRDVGEEEYLALGGAWVVLDLDLHHRIGGRAAGQAGHDLLPPRRRRPQERFDAAPGVARQPEPFRPREVEQRAGVDAEDAARGGVGEDDPTSCSTRTLPVRWTSSTASRSSWLRRSA